MMKEHPYALFRPYAANPDRAFSITRRSPDLRTATIFLDTNVLLAPYRNSSEALDAIQAMYARLRAEGRLVVPAQVAREFARNRPTLVAQLHKSLRDANSHNITRFDAPPILHGLPEYQSAHTAMTAIDAELRKYRRALAELLTKIEYWEHNDPVLQVYSAIFDSAVVIDLSMDPATLESVRKARYDAKVPPGFRDKAKDDGGVGDLAIWLTILETCAQPPRDAVLVTEDSKDDWFHVSQGQRLFPRYELVEEFALHVVGGAFGISTLAALLQAHGAPETVVDEVAERERMEADSNSAKAYSIRAQFVDYAIARLIAATDTRGHIERSGKWPTMRLILDNGVIGLQVVPVHSLLEGGDVFALASKAILDAQDRSTHESFIELVVVFIAETLSSAILLKSWYADGDRTGPRMSIVVSVNSNGLFATILNLSENAVIRLAFGHTLRDA